MMDEFILLPSAFCLHNSRVRILGIDPGSITTGFGVIDADRGRLVLVELGSINTPRRAELADRLQQIHDGLLSVIARTTPAAVAVETPFAGQNMKSLIQLAHARGVILLAPRSVKSAVVGYGAAEKQQVAKMVRILISGCAQQVMSADASDALAVAICHAHTHATTVRLKIAR